MKLLLRIVAIAALGLIGPRVLAGNLNVTLTPSQAVTAGAQWRVDGGAWHNSGTSVNGLSNASHTVDFKAVSGWVTPASRSVTISSGSNNITQAYIQASALKITLTPSGGQWRIDGGAWNASASTVSNLTPGSHTVDYSALTNYAAPATESVTLISGQTTTLTRSYTALNQVMISLVPSTGQWRVDGGAWQASGASLWVMPGSHTIDYSSLTFYDSPPAETITTGLIATRTYTSTKPKLRVNLAPSTAPSGQWRLDGGAWQPSGTQLTELATGSHTIDYVDVGGVYSPLASETISLALRDNLTLDRTYPFKNVPLTVTLSPSSGTWMASGGVTTPLMASGATASVPPGNYTIQYGAVTNYTAPPVENITIAPGGSASLTRTYATMPAHLRITTNVTGGQWRVYPQGGTPGATWQNSADTVDLAVGTYTVEYASVPNYAAPASETVTLTSNDYQNLSRSYTPLPAHLSVHNNLGAQWRTYLQGGTPGATWQNSSDTLALAPGTYVVEYAPMATWIAPAAETITLAPNETRTLDRTYAPAPSGVSVHLTPTNAQWRVDGGAWQASDATVSNLTAGSHTVDFAPLAGYQTPASQTLTIPQGATGNIYVIYLASAQLTITLAPANAQWRVDGGAWQASGATVSDLSPSNHAVEYAALAGYFAPPSETVALNPGESRALSRAYAQAAALTVNLTPAAAQWRIDGGVWQNSGATVSNLFPTNHTVDYSPVAGYAAQPSETVGISAGQSITLTRAYTGIAQVTITLSPSTAQWRIDGGAWQPSGATLANIPTGAHTIDYSNVSGYAALASESLALSPGQNAQLTRAYTALAQLTVNLTPASAQWRVDGGAWQAGGASVPNLSVGSHTIDYLPVTGYESLASESVTLTSGQLLNLTRAYVQLAQVTISLTPASGQWRIDGGAWQASGASVPNLSLGSHTIDYAALAGYVAPASESVTLTAGQLLNLARAYTQLAQVTVNLTPASAQWRIDGGAWQASGASVSNLSLGSHTIDYAALAGYVAPPSESVTLTAGQLLNLTRSYTQLAQLTVTLTPSSGQWRVDGGAWNASGATVANLTPGDHAVDYSAVSGYNSPAAETVTLTPGQLATLSRSYTAQPAQVTVTLTPSSGQWRVYPAGSPGGAWQSSAATVSGLTPGGYTIEYTTLTGYTPPPSENVTLTPGQSLSLTRSHTPLAAQITVATAPSSGQWRIYSGSTPSGAWNASGATVSGLAPGTYNVAFTVVSGYTAPAPTAVTLAPGEAKSLTGIYAPNPTQINVALSLPAAQWRVDGGAWRPAGTSATGLSVGTHLLEFSTEAGHASPPAQSITLNTGDSINYRFLYVPLGGGSISINLTPSHAQWRVDGGPWQISGATVANLALGTHALEYSDVPGLTKPYTTQIQLDAEWNNPARLFLEYNPTYTNLQMNLTPSSGTYRYNGWGPHPSGSAVATLSGTPALYTYEPLTGYYPPHSEILSANTTAWGGVVVNRAYTTTPPTSATVSVGLNVQQAQWRLYSGSTPSGPWQTGSASITGLAAGDYTIEYAAVANLAAPPAESFTLATGQDLALLRNYAPLPSSVTVTTNPPATNNWSMTQRWGGNGTIWSAPSGGTVNNVPPGEYVINFGSTQDYITPFQMIVMVGSGEPISITKTYQHVFDVSVSLSPYTARWRIDGGAWQASDAGVWGLAAGQHTIDYEPVAGYAPLASETINVTPGSPQQLYRSYQQYASITANVYPPPDAQWRVDGGPWQVDAATVGNLSFGMPHTIEYSAVTGYVTPPSQTVTLSAGQLYMAYGSYTALSKITGYVSVPSGTWRVDGGAWQVDGATVANLSFGVPHTVEFGPVTGYLTAPTQTVTLYPGQNYSVYGGYPPLARATVDVNPANVSWRIDGGPWQTGAGTAANLMFGVPHSIQYAALPGYATPLTEQFTLYSGQNLNLYGWYSSLGTNRVKFFIHPDLAAGLTPAQLQGRLAQYVAHLAQIFTRETSRVIPAFDPADVTITASDPFNSASGGPETGFALWVWAVPTDNATVGMYGGSVDNDVSGAGGLRGVKWDQIYDPSTLADGSPALEQYWRQLHLMLAAFERTFGAGRGEYTSLAGLHDASGVAPASADTAAVDSATPDAFWNARFDYWTDPLTANAYANPRLGSPTSLATLLNLVSFAPPTRGVINGLFRGTSTGLYQVPDLANVVVKVVDAQTGQPIPNATLRAWNRTTPAAPNTTYEETVTTTAPGVFRFSWTGGSAPFDSAVNAKLLKATATGYAPAAQWTTIYDGQKARLIDGQFTFEVIVPLTTQ